MEVVSDFHVNIEQNNGPFCFYHLLGSRDADVTGFSVFMCHGDGGVLLACLKRDGMFVVLVVLQGLFPGAVVVLVFLDAPALGSSLIRMLVFRDAFCTGIVHSSVRRRRVGIAVGIGSGQITGSLESMIFGVLGRVLVSGNALREVGVLGRVFMLCPVGFLGFVRMAFLIGDGVATAVRLLGRFIFG